MKITPVKLFWLILGCLSLALGCIGIFLPVLPTVPFFLLTAFSFAKSSERLHTWFIATKLYKKHLESFVKKEGMLPQTKASIIISVTLLMGFGFFMMARKGIWIPCIILFIVWLCHIIYFLFRVPTIHKNKKLDEEIEQGPEQE
ncbi:MAG: YbaN family protein [Treponema sp.]|nr:YbaN family protein [Treponema sp.]